MDERSSNPILVWALAISLGIHVVFAIVARTVPTAEAAPEPPQHIEIVRIATPHPSPPPTPRPARPVAASHKSTHARVSVHPPRVVAHGGGPVSTGPSAIATTGPPLTGNDVSSAAAPSPAPACSNPFEPAYTIAAVVPEAPEDAAGIKATAQVQVTLDDRGRVTDTRIFSSTGTMSLDRAAVDAARRTTYAPSIVDCQPTGGTYLFKVDFDA
jgi:protein TonB